MDRSDALKAILTLLDEGGRLIPGERPFKIVSDYIEFKIDRLGPEKAIQDVINTKDHLVAQIDRLTV